MIDAAVLQIRDELNQYMRRTVGFGEDIVRASSVLEQDGTLAPEGGNKLLVFLVNVERDASTPTHPGASTNGSMISSTLAPVHLNLFVMIAAHFGNANYPEALKALSAAVGFFQGKPTFHHGNSQGLDPHIDRLVFEIQNLSLPDLSSLWGMIGGSYLPSVLYKVRMVSIDSASVSRRVPAVDHADGRAAAAAS